MPVLALPVDRSRSAIADAVFESRVSIVQGSTGCGKSSRVPQFLLEDVGGPVLCTQPRRLAVVSIAKRVAEERGALLGGDEVGYRIGQRPHYNNRTQIVFATAGVLLEDLKAHGAASLTRYKVIVLDEVHERSVESDLVLACVREFMKEHRRVKLVLMSATCDVESFSDFFRPISDGRLARIQLNDLGLTLSNLLRSTTVRYLEDAVKLLSGEDEGAKAKLPPPLPLPIPLPLSHKPPPAAGGSGSSGSREPPRVPTPGATLDWPASGSGASLAPSDDESGGQQAQQAQRAVSQVAVLQYKKLLEEAKAAAGKVEGKISDVEQRLLRDLVCRLHRDDPDLGSTVLMFLPTYKHLELQHELLLASGLPLSVFALHSSVDIDECIAAMEVAAGGKRKVILATNIAESSVTVPSVRYVLDSCRTLRLCWDRVARRTDPQIVFASRSQADQRKGRTGRTCDGIVYRLLPRKVFLEGIPRFEAPALTMLHLRRETLGLLCAASPLMSNPMALLRCCMTPPEAEVASDALAYLAGAGAASPGGSGCGYQPSLFGRLLGGLPVSIEGAQLVANGGKAGLLRPAVLLAAITNITPFPIHQPFASAEQHRQNLRRYGGLDVAPADAQAVLLANLSAYLFWEHAWRDRQRLQRLRSLAAGGGEGSSSHASSNTSRNSSSKGAASGGGGGKSSGGAGSRERGGAAAVAAGGVPRSGGGVLPDGDEEEQEWCLRHRLIRSSLHSVAELADTIMQVLYQHRPDFLHSPANLGPPPHFCAAAAAYGGGGRSGQRGAAHACMMAPAPRQWGSDAAGAASQQCVAPSPRLGAFYDGEAAGRLAELVLSKDVEPASLAAGSGTGFGQRYGFGDGSEPSLFGARSFYRTPTAQLCKFFLSARGCSRGPDCRFSHDAAAALSSDMLATLRRPVSFASWQQQDGSCRAGGGGSRAVGASSGVGEADSDVACLFDFGSGDTVLLLGEGDLSFTEALLRHCPSSPRLVSTVQLSRSDLLAAHPGCRPRVERLEAAAAPAAARLRLLFGLCATQLHRLGGPGCTVSATHPAAAAPSQPRNSSKGSGSGPGDPGGADGSFRLASASHILLNFPHSGQDEDDEGHRRLMADIFASAGAALLAQGGSAEVLLTLCNDQFSRWHVEASARDAFFFLEQSAHFTPASFPGYTPRRGYNDDAFPHERAVTYRLTFHPPAGGVQ